MAFTPGNIVATHVLQAARKIKAEGITTIPGTRYTAIVEGDHYPPKELMRYAHEVMNGERIWLRNGGPETNGILEKLGFTIEEKRNKAILEMIAKYKVHVKAHGMQDELYKWELIERFKGRPDPEATDLLAEIRAVNFANLLYQMASSVMKHLAQARQEQYRACLKALFDESQPLELRVPKFTADTLHIYREIVPEERYGHHQDERTAGVLLAYHSPERYAIYKDSFYKKYCKLLGIKHKWKGEKYIHYQELMQSLINDYISEDLELLELTAQNLSPTAYADPNHLLLAQNILYMVLDQGKGIEEEDEGEVWIIQCDPERYDFASALAAGKLKNWTVAAHRERIREGDQFILWMTGKQNGCYGLGTISSDVYLENIEIDAQFWRVEREFKPHDAVDVEFTHIWLQQPLPSKMIRADSRFAQFKGGSQGTILSATQEEYDALISLHQSLYPKTMDSKFPLNQILYGPPGTGKTFNSITRALEILGIEYQNRVEAKRKFDELMEAGRIDFVTFHQSMSYEDFVEGIKPQVKEEDDTFLSYEVKPGIFKILADFARSNPSDTMSESTTILPFEKAMELLQEDWETNPGMKISMKNSRNNYTIKSFNPAHIKITTTTNGSHKNVVITNLRDFYYGKLGVFKEGDWVYYPGMISKLRSYAPEKTNDHSEKPFILIIDEINRGNVSQIFGELITLIEEDKRAGNPEALRVTLPYSQDEFSVPPNLYIIGTMNTADRSVEALDTALRRRFEFVEMAPNPMLVSEQLDDAPEVSPRDLLYTINLRIEKLLDRDHQIGHAYFMGLKTITQLQHAFQHKLLPLLQEYFYGDYSKIGLVLGRGFVYKVSGHTQRADEIFANFDSEYRSDLAQREVWHLHPIANMAPEVFKAALTDLKVLTYPGS